MLMPDPYLSANANNVTHHGAEADSRTPSPTGILPHPHLMAVDVTVVTAITAVPVIPVVPVVPAVATVQVAPVVPAAADCRAPADVDVDAAYTVTGVPTVDALPIEAVAQTVAEAPTEVAAQAAAAAHTAAVALTTSDPTHPHPALAILHVAAALTEATRNTGRLKLWEAG
jgi:hypothetical protein